MSTTAAVVKILRLQLLKRYNLPVKDARMATKEIFIMR